MPFKPLLVFLLPVLLSCNNTATNNYSRIDAGAVNTNEENPYTTIQSVPLPQGFERTAADSSDFAYWLRNISLHKNRTVHLYNGAEKQNQQAQFAVLNISVGNKDLQQCADAVMRLRAEYLFAHKRFTEIVFYDNNKTAYNFTAPYNRSHFDVYLQQVFGMCGSASLSKQIAKNILVKEVQPGDVFIRGGFPGHAVIVTDVAIDSSGKKIFMLAQSYMPAQEIHVLKNPLNKNLSPWYEADDAEKIITPEYTFTKNELKRW